MSIGFASIIIIGNWAYNEYSFDRFHNNKDRIYRLVEKQTYKAQDEKYLSSMPEWLIGMLEEEINGIEASTGLLNVGNIWFGEKDNRIEVKNVTYTNNKIFNIFTLDLITGSSENALTNPYSAVLTKSLAHRFFKDKSPVGQTILNQDEKEYTITGVIEDIPDNSHFQAEMFVSIEERKSSWNRDNYNHTTSMYLLLGENTDPNSLWEPLQKSKEKHMPEDVESTEFQIQPLSEIHLYSKHTIWGQNWKKSDIFLIRIFMFIGILIMIISTINYVNLSTASITKRHKEFGLKKVVGAGKSILIFQYVFESFLLLFTSFWVSIILIEIANPLLIKFDILNTPNYIYHQLLFYLLIMVFILVLSVLSSIYPAIILASINPITLFRINNNTSSHGLSLRRLLVVTQLTIACALTITVIYISKQINFMQQKDLGYAKEAVINFWSDNKFRDNYESIKSHLLTYNDILDVTASNMPIGMPAWRNCIHFEDEPEGDSWTTPYMMVDYNFVDFYDIKVLKGRGFNKNIALDRNERAFLVNETLAKKIGGESIIGRKFRTCNSQWGEIVGIIHDFNYRSLHHSIEPLAIQLGKDYNNMISINANVDNIPNTIAILETVWSKYQPDQPFRFSFLDENLDNLYQTEKKIARFEVIFCVVAIVLSCIGLLGIFLFVTERKTKEIGIRKVNGASVNSIIIILSHELITNVAIALLIAIPIGWFAINQWRENFAYKTELSWWIFGVSGILILFIAWFTVSYHAINAARKNPIEALRYE